MVWCFGVFFEQLEKLHVRDEPKSVSNPEARLCPESVGFKPAPNDSNISPCSSRLGGCVELRAAAVDSCRCQRVKVNQSMFILFCSHFGAIKHRAGLPLSLWLCISCSCSDYVSQYLYLLALGTSFRYIFQKLDLLGFRKKISQLYIRFTETW